MAKSRRFLMALALLLPWAQGCSRPLGFHGDEGAPQAGQAQAPLRKADLPQPTSAIVDQSQNSALPFADSPSLPAGTLMTVRLTKPVWTDAPDASGTFEAVVDEVVTMDGNTVVPRGATVAGRVESARASKIKDNRNYVRLTLDTIALDGRDFPVQTSSLFARGRSSITATSEHKDALAVIHLEKGRRLTFRLAEPLYVAARLPLPTH